MVVSPIKENSILKLDFNHREAHNSVSSSSIDALQNCEFDSSTSQLNWTNNFHYPNHATLSMKMSIHKEKIYKKIILE